MYAVPLSETRGMFFDRKGREISLFDGLRLRHCSRRGYERVGQTMVGNLEVSTVWLGANHNYRGGRPLIFETMTFGEGEFDLMTWRYSTLREAEVGHRRVVRLMRLLYRSPLFLAKPRKTRNRHWR